MGIVNVVGSTIAREVNSGIYLHAGPEIGVASTKAFTCQITALTLLAIYLRQERPEVGHHELLELPQKVQGILDKADEIKKIAEVFSQVKNALYLGRGNEAWTHCFN